MSRGGLLSATLAAITVMPFFFVLLATPVSAQAISGTVTSPESDSVVEAMVTLNGTAHDPAGKLKTVEIAIDGVSTPLTVGIPGNQENATWETTWDSTEVPDGRTSASMTVANKVGEVSEPLNFTFIVDNDKNPAMEVIQLLFDPDGNGTYVPWNDTSATPTTRLSFEVHFSEEMDDPSLEVATNFTGGESSWEIMRRNITDHWVNVSYLKANTSYNFTMGSSATDLGGNPVMTNRYEFHTVAEPTPGTPETPTDPGDQNGGFLGFSLPVDPLWLMIGGGAAVAVAVGLVVARRKGFLPRRKASKGSYDWGSDDEEQDEGGG